MRHHPPVLDDEHLAGVEAAQEFARLVADSGLDATPAQAAIAWVAQQPGVTTVIPGARNTDQARSNAAAGEVGPLPDPLVAAVADLYDRPERYTRLPADLAAIEARVRATVLRNAA